MFKDPNFISKLQENIESRLSGIQFNFVNARTLQSGGAIDINKNEIKIVTYNVHQNLDNSKIRKKLITELNADIYLLQEAIAESKQDFTPTPNYEFKFKNSGGSRNYGEAIVYNKTTLDISTA